MVRTTTLLALILLAAGAASAEPLRGVRSMRFSVHQIQDTAVYSSDPLLDQIHSAAMKGDVPTAIRGANGKAVMITGQGVNMPLGSGKNFNPARASSLGLKVSDQLKDALNKKRGADTPLSKKASQQLKHWQRLSQEEKDALPSPL